MIRVKPRKEVREFAEFMEIKLRQNEHKGRWDDCQDQYLLERVSDEVDELIDAVNSGVKKDIVQECVDVANFAMVLASNQVDLSGRTEEVDPLGG